MKRLVQRHLRYTGSEVARRLLLNWEREKRSFVKVGGGDGDGRRAACFGRLMACRCTACVTPPAPLLLLHTACTRAPPPQVFPHEYRRALAEADAIKAAEEAQKELLAQSGARGGRRICAAVT